MPDITADLVGNNLNWDGYGAESVSIKGHLPWRGDSGTLAVQGQQVNAGMLLNAEHGCAGQCLNLRLAAQTRNEMGAVELQGSVRQQGTQWRGELARCASHR
jgi:translocation and assembly module TamB